MKLFLDTANVEEIRAAAEWGILDGVTTNPSLVAKEGRDFMEVLREITAIVDGPISAEVVSTKASDMVTEGRKLAKVHKNIYVKVPMTTEGLKATKILSGEGTRVNMTLVFSSLQALLAAKVGAAYVSPFIGRLDDIGQTGMEIIEEISTIYQNYSFKTEILVASIRHPIHVKEAALLGADIATMPFSVLEKLPRHSLTDIGLDRFLKDWAKLPKK
ncbi:MAG: fructose-6-phosphate aldolase [Candidatus Thermoplasmatota archaeon]|jgi:transaldolase|nr:fructose-6-phosphate aldolase [Candidatus Thermoplasmatota archaeon]MCL5984371.1 fructose-6-phosphate aldolase [Candidatus Thermoplasmatota archaeon]